MQPSPVGPLVFARLGRTAPPLDEFAVLIELQDRLRRFVPVVERVSVLQSMRALEDPDISMAVGTHTSNSPHHQPIGHLWKVGVHFKNRQNRLLTLSIQGLLGK